MKAFVLSGGANRGAMEVGALLALFERGIVPDLVVGSSAGAINAAFIAGDPTLAGAGRLAEIWRGIRKEHVFPGSRLAVLWRLFRRRDRFYEPDALAETIAAHLGYRDLSRARIPVIIVATDLGTGREHWFSSGDAVRAILASTALPGIFPPVEIDGRRYLDGGLSNRTPISAAVANGADHVYVLDVGYPCKCERLYRSVVDITTQALGIMGAQRLLADLEHYAERCTVVHISLPCQLEVRFTDFSKTEQMIAEAYQLAQQALDGSPAGAVWLDQIKTPSTS